MKSHTKKQINRMYRFVTTMLKGESVNEEPDVCTEAGKLLLEMEEYYEPKLKQHPMCGCCPYKEVYNNLNTGKPTKININHHTCKG